MGPRTLRLGGPKQRAVLALLLLRAEEVVPVERLVDELWGADAPASADHTVETYVSRLRGTLEPYGPTILRRGRGYVLELRGAELDVRRVAALVDAAGAAEDRSRARTLAAEALACWRGRPLVDTAFAGTPAEVAQLEELRRRAFELRADAELAAGKHAEIVGELRSLVDEYPHSERLVAQLMVALYRAGRQAEALAVYERTRRRLGEELGLLPSRELQALSAQIVRHEEGLTAPALAPAPPSRGRRRGAVAALTATAGLAVAAALLYATHGGGSAVSRAKGPHVALILPRLPKAGREDTFVTPFVDGLQLAARQYGLHTDVLLGDERHFSSPPQKRLAARVGAPNGP